MVTAASERSHQPGEPIMHCLGRDAEVFTDPPPRHAALTSPADVSNAFLVDELLQATDRLQRRRWVIVQMSHEVSPLCRRRHPKSLADHPRKPQEIRES